VAIDRKRRNSPSLMVLLFQSHGIEGGGTEEKENVEFEVNFVVEILPKKMIARVSLTSKSQRYCHHL
jgi:hypothetical protein